MLRQISPDNVVFPYHTHGYLCSWITFKQFAIFSKKMDAANIHISDLSCFTMTHDICIPASMMLQFCYNTFGSDLNVHFEAFLISFKLVDLSSLT